MRVFVRVVRDDGAIVPVIRVRVALSHRMLGGEVCVRQVVRKRNPGRTEGGGGEQHEGEDSRQEEETHDVKGSEVRRPPAPIIGRPI